MRKKGNRCHNCCCETGEYRLDRSDRKRIKLKDIDLKSHELIKLEGHERGASTDIGVDVCI